MKIRADKIRSASDALATHGLNAAEDLRIAERLIEDVLVRLCPLVSPYLCQAEGMLQVARHAIEVARGDVAAYPRDDLPVDPDIEPEAVANASTTEGSAR